MAEEAPPEKGSNHANPFPAEVDDAVLEDLRARLQWFRPVKTAGAHGWERGVDPTYLAELVHYWAHTYDWREHEQRIRALPWVAVNNGPTPLRLIHQRAGHDAMTVVLLHGSPDSMLRFERLLPLQTDLNVVVPSLPGFPFSLPVHGNGRSSVAMAKAVAESMEELGYSRYVLSAEDVGCDIAEALAASHPRAVSALHLTDVSQYHFLVNPPTDLSTREEEYVRYGHHWQATEGGYMHAQSTKPQTVAVGLGDSPAGLAAPPQATPDSPRITSPTAALGDLTGNPSSRRGPLRGRLWQDDDMRISGARHQHLYYLQLQADVPFHQ